MLSIDRGTQETRESREDDQNSNKQYNPIETPLGSARRGKKDPSQKLSQSRQNVARSKSSLAQHPMYPHKLDNQEEVEPLQNKSMNSFANQQKRSSCDRYQNVQVTDEDEIENAPSP